MRRAVLLVLVLGACGDDSGSARPDAPVVVGVAPVITAVSLPALTEGVVASPVTFEATGDDPIEWTVTTGMTPPGMTLTTAGSYTGTPTAPGDYMFNVTATNAAGSDTITLTQTVGSQAKTAFALLASNRITSFAPGFPGGASAAVELTGVVAGDTLFAIDRRPMNGQLYGLGFNSTAGTVRLYAIHPATSSAFPLAAGAQAFDDNPTPNPVTGTALGLDLNAAVDRFRVVTSTGQNFRINPNTGVVVDADGDIGTGIQRDPALNGSTTGATETAYTNNQINNGNLSTQYTVNGATLYHQSNPNGGTTAPIGSATGVTSIVGLDLAPGINAVTQNVLLTGGAAYAIVATGSAQQGGTINLTSGAFTSQGTFTATDIRGLALSTGERTIVGLSNDGTTLLRFQETQPSSIGTVTLSGLVAGETLVGIDFRPATGQLYAIGINGTNDTGTLYLVDPQGGIMTPVVASGIAPAATDFPLPASTRYSVDFNPGVDRIRLIASTGLNLRINPLDGTGTTVDTAYATSVDNAAYTNGHPGAGTALATLYAISGATNSLYVITNPNGAQIGTSIAITQGGNPLDFSSAAAFDIPQSVTTATLNTAVTAGFAYGVLTVAGVTNLYRIDLVTGAASAIGTVAAGSASLLDIAVGQ